MADKKPIDAATEALRAISAVGADAAARGEDPGPLWEAAAAAAARAYAEKQAAAVAARRAKRGAP